MFNEDDYKKIQKELKDLREKLHKSNIEKEKWFSRKEELKKEVAELVLRAKALRIEKDKINNEVKKVKVERDEQNKKTKEFIEKLRNSKTADSGEKIRSSRNLKEEIEKLEHKIEIEALKFSDEKKLMKIISKLKQELSKAKKTEEQKVGREDINKNINQSKIKAEKKHEDVKNFAGLSKNNHKNYLEVSKRIKDVNAEQEKAFNNFLKFKEEFNLLSKRIDSETVRFRSAKVALEKNKGARKEAIDRKKKKVLTKHAEDVEAKLKKGEKLTTEDLIKFQGKDD